MRDLKHSIIVILFSSLSSLVFAVEPPTAEQLGNTQKKLSALTQACDALVPLLDKVKNAAIRADISANLKTVTDQVVKATDTVYQGSLPSHESLSGWKTAFFGLRFQTCDQLSKEIQEKREGLSSLRVVTKKLVDSQKKEFVQYCDADGKMLGNQEIDKSINNVLKNLEWMGEIAVKVDEIIKNPLNY